MSPPPVPNAMKGRTPIPPRGAKRDAPAAEVVFVSDGSTWLLEHLVPTLAGAIVVLGPHHLVDWFSR